MTAPSYNILDYSLILAYVAIITDISMQIARIYKRKSAADISILGTTVRFLATLVFLTKYVTIQDPFLTVGQSVFSVLLLAYLVLIIRLRLHSLSFQSIAK